MKKIIVTGGLGFIGSNLISTFIKNKHLVVGIDMLNTGCGSDFIKKTGGKVERIKFVKGLSTSNIINKLKKN